MSGQNFCQIYHTRGVSISYFLSVEVSEGLELLLCHFEFDQLPSLTNFQPLNPILLGWSHTFDFIRGGDKFVLHPRNTESSKKKC